MIESKKYIKYELKVLALLYKKGWFFFFFSEINPKTGGVLFMSWIFTFLGFVGVELWSFAHC